MKKLIIAVTAILIASVSYGQTDSTMRKQDPPPYNGTPRSYSDPNTTPNQTEKIPDGYIMQNGKMMAVKNGSMTLLDNDVTLANGVTIMKNGNYTMKGGNKIMLKEGELIDMTGNIVKIKATPPKN